MGISNKWDMGILQGDAAVRGVEAIKFYGGATEGLRTLLDALSPAAAALARGPSPCN